MATATTVGSCSLDRRSSARPCSVCYSSSDWRAGEGSLFSSREKHIAVLPLNLVGADAEGQALGDGLMDSLAGKIANLDAANPSLFVVPASEVRSRKVTDSISAMREFGATIVVQASSSATASKSD